MELNLKLRVEHFSAGVFIDLIHSAEFKHDLCAM